MKIGSIDINEKLAAMNEKSFVKLMRKNEPKFGMSAEDAYRKLNTNKAKPDRTEPE